MAVSPSNTNVLLFTPFSVFVFYSSRAKWVSAPSLFPVRFLSFLQPQDAFITAAAWVSDTILLLAVSPRSEGFVGATIFAFNASQIAPHQAIQEIELKFTPSRGEFHPSQLRLLPRFLPTPDFVHICSIDPEIDSFLCTTTTGTTYLFHFSSTRRHPLTPLRPEALNSFSVTHLPVSFSAKDEALLPAPVRTAFWISTTRTVATEEGAEEVACQDVLFWLRDGSLWMRHLTEELEDHCVFDRLQQAVFSNRRDAPTVHLSYIFPDYLLFFTHNSHTVRPSHTHHPQAWFPSLDPAPSPLLIQPRTDALAFGYSWKSLSFFCLQGPTHARDASLHAISVCSFHLLLAALLYSRQNTVAAAVLTMSLQRNPFGANDSLEYLLHFALNSGNPSFLAATFQLLSQLPLFSRILVRCLRKQERSMWPFAIKNTCEVCHLFHSFLLSDDFEYAVTTISILQGLACSVADEWPKPAAEAYHPVSLKQWRGCVKGDSVWVLERFASVMEEKGEDCVAHVSALQLLLVIVIRGYFSQLAEVYRFLVMEVGVGEKCEA